MEDRQAERAARRLDAGRVDERDDGEPVALDGEEARPPAAGIEERMVLDRVDDGQRVGAGCRGNVLGREPVDAEGVGQLGGVGAAEAFGVSHLGRNPATCDEREQQGGEETGHRAAKI